MPRLGITRIDMETSPGSFVNITADVLMPVRMRRGMPGNSPKDYVATSGTLEFDLANWADAATGRPVGYYSPNHPNVRSGFTHGVQVRLFVDYDGNLYPVFTGRIRVILPDPGTYRAPRVHCVAHDYMADLSNADVREVPQQVSKTEVELYQAVLDALPAASQPFSTSFDSALDTYDLALDDLAGGQKGLGVMERITTSARGMLYTDSLGILTYRNRVSRALQTSEFTFTEDVLTGLVVPSSLDNVYNRVRGVLHPKTVTATQVLATHTGPLSIAPGETVELWLDYCDPTRTELRIGGTDGVAPVATTDYVFNSSSTGLGTNLTADMTVSADYFSSTVKLTITNGHATLTAWRILLQVRGKGVYDLSPIAKEAFSAEDYGDLPIEFDFPYQWNEATVQAEIDFIQAQYRGLEDQVEQFSFRPQNSTALMEAMLALEIGDVVTVSESMTLPTETPGYVQWIQLDVEPGEIMTCTVGLAPRITQEEAETDVLYLGDTFAETQHDPDNFQVGTALVGFSEAA